MCEQIQKNLILFTVFLLLAFRAIDVLAQEEFKHHFQHHFDSLGLNGSTTIYDYKNKTWFFTNRQDAETPTLPASTFKIPNSLIILDKKAVAAVNEVMEWDGETKYHLGHVISAWNADTDMVGAFKNSTIWFYEEAARRIGHQHYRETLNRLGYGNGNFTETETDFWNHGEFAISPMNQITFLIMLFENRLPFSDETIEKVKKLMFSERTPTHIYRGKTGWTRRNGTDIGWWVGYAETNDNVYFFATRLLKDEDDDNPDFSKARIELTKQILHEVTKNKVTEMD